MGIWYRTGTVAVTNGSPNVVGTGTLWLTQASVGDIFVGPDGADYEIASITDDTHIAVKQKNGTAAYAGATLSAQAYAIIRNFTSTLPAQLASQLAEMMTAWHVTTDELTAWLSGTGSVVVHDAVGNAYTVQTPAAIGATINGRLVKSVAGAADVTLTSAEAANLFLEFTGTLTGNINVILPAGARSYFVYNGTAGDFTLTVKTAAGTGKVIARGGRELVECDGTNVVLAVTDKADPVLLYKLDPMSVAITKTAAGTISIKAGSSAIVAGVKLAWAADTAVTMPTLTAGVDYAIYVCTDGTLRADASFTNPTGYTTANSRMIGGFHYSAIPAGTTVGIAAGFSNVSAATRAGTTTNASAVITGLASTADLHKGMDASGTGITAGANILSVDSASQVTLTVAATATGSPSITFVNTGKVWTQAEVDAIAGINKYSLWDIKWRSNSPDLRAQKGFYYESRINAWAPIYKPSTDTDTNGLSKYNSNIASGTVLPKIPTAFGGNGTTTYPALNWMVANEIARAYGCRQPRQSEFNVLAFGVFENASLGGASVTVSATAHEIGFTSEKGMEQATGHQWVRGEDSNFYSEVASPAGSWKSISGTTGAAGSERGQIYTFGTYGLVRVLLGGGRANGAVSGSGCALFSNPPTSSDWAVSCFAVCDHLTLV